MAWLPAVPTRWTAFCGPADPRVLPRPHAPRDTLPVGGTPSHHLHGTRARPAVCCPSRAVKGHRMVPSEPRVLALTGTWAPCPRLQSPQGFSWRGMNSGSVGGPVCGQRAHPGSTPHLRTLGTGWQFSYCEAGVPTGAHSECGFGPALVQPSGQDAVGLCSGCGMSPSTRMRSSRPLVRTATPTFRPAGSLGQLPFPTTGVGV